MEGCGYVLRISFFFFQAEDGIRDLTVTGVQTCALPIYLAERDDVVFGGEGVGDAGAVQERAVGGADVLHLHAAVGEAELGVLPRDGRVVNLDVARDGPPHDDGAARLEIDRLLTRRAQQLEHRGKIYVRPRPARTPGPSTRPAPWLPFRRTREPDRSRRRCPPPPAR